MKSAQSATSVMGSSCRLYFMYVRTPHTYVLIDEYGVLWNRASPGKIQSRMKSCPDADNGYAVTCNHKVTTDDYPYTISQHYGGEMRARRVTARIEQVPPGAMTVARMGSIHKERVSISAQWVIQTVAASVDPSGLSHAALTLRELLLSWDGDM